MTYRGRRKPPPREILDQITAAAAAGDEDLVERLSAQAVRAEADRRHRAEPLPIRDEDL